AGRHFGRPGTPPEYSPGSTADLAAGRRHGGPPASSRRSASRGGLPEDFGGPLVGGIACQPAGPPQPSAEGEWDRGDRHRAAHGGVGRGAERAREAGLGEERAGGGPGEGNRAGHPRPGGGDPPAGGGQPGERAAAGAVAGGFLADPGHQEDVV